MTVSFAVIMIVASVASVKWGPVKVSHLFLGLLTGIAIGGTALGAGIQSFSLDMLNTLAEALTGVVA